MASDDFGADTDSSRETTLRRLHAEGRTLEDMGHAFGITRERARQLLEDMGLNNRDAQARRVAWLSETRGDEIEQAFLEERDDALVAERLGLRRADVEAVVDGRLPDTKVLRQRPTAHQPRYSDLDLIRLLREAAKQLHEPLAHDAYNTWAQGQKFDDGRSAPTHQTMALRWGSWRAALKNAGLEVGPRLGPRSALTRQAVVAAVVECWRDLGGPPTVAVYDAWSAGRSDVPSSASARKFIDGWQDARLSAWEIIHNISLPRTDLPGVERVEPDPESGEPILAVQGQAGEGLSNDDRNPPVEEVGVPYRPADEEADPNPAALAAPDPELVRAAWRSHARLQNELADLARAAGLVPLSPHRDPRFDIAWRSQAGTLVICEVKSADIDTGEAQIRAAFAQVLRYQLGAERRFGEAVEARIYIEREPDELWLALCDRFGLKVAFPPHARTLIDE